MPHVKGNKFKPKLPEEPPKPEAPVEDATPAAAPRPAKKQRQKPPPPVIPTVVAPAPSTNGAPKQAATSNWDALKASMQARKKPATQKKRKTATVSTAPASTEPAQPTKLLAIDCEMVGVGKDGARSALARVSVVNAAGSVVYDSFVDPGARVTDFRTRWSGIRPADIKGAPPLDQIRSKVRALLRGRVLVGHAVHHDLEALGLPHPETDVRDTSRYPPLMKALPGGRSKPRALRHLAAEHLDLAIQGGEHCSVEDARAALALYQKHRAEWERWLSGGGVAPAAAAAPAADHPKKKKQKASAGPLGTDQLALLAKADYMADL
jgi:RNA exonuclease 4